MLSSKRDGTYPHNWPQLRLRRLKQAHYRCQEPGCGVLHYAEGWRHDDGTFTQGWPEERVPGARYIRVCLALTHLDDPNPANCAADNLRVRCQRCHNLADAVLRAQRATQTRWKHKVLRCQSLF